MCVKLHTVSKITHCVQKYTVRSLFRVNCEEKKFPSINLFYTSTAIDAMDKYQVWLKDLDNRVSVLCNSLFG